MNTRIVAMGLVTLVVVVGASILGTWRWASAYGPDVNVDGHVRIDDILAVVHAYYQDVPTPPIPVQEQNVDGNGNIKVHEQGTVNVSAAAPLQVQQQGAIDVNVLSEPQPQAVHLVLHETVVAIGTGKVRTSFADTSACADFIAMNKVVSPAGSTLRFTDTTQYASPDGTTSVPVETKGILTGVTDLTGSLRFSGTYPYFSIFLNGGAVGDTAEVWLYCR